MTSSVRTASARRATTPPPPHVPIAQIDAFHLESCLRLHAAQTGNITVARSDLKTWPLAMGISQRRFSCALEMLRTAGHLWIETVGKSPIIHLNSPPTSWQANTWEPPRF
jgi:hypothetical protein